MRAIGLHLRLHDNFLTLAQQAHSLSLPIFQCFFISQETHEAIKISDQEIETFLRDYRPHFKSIYLHASYWMNLSNVRSSRHRVFFRERALAERLQFTHMVIHPGAATGGRSKKDGIDALARFLNTINKQEPTIKIVLENTTHKGLSVGGDIEDFRQLLQKLEYPDRTFFCIDTAHAYVYGYDISNAAEQLLFIDLLDAAIGISRIALIHVNDTKEKLGSHIDKHAVVGQGLIGGDALRSFVLDERLKNSDIILELPSMPIEKERAVLAQVMQWHK